MESFDTVRMEDIEECDIKEGILASFDSNMSATTGSTWTVVQFDDSSVEAVPTNWIQGNVCHWPLMPHPKLIASIRRNEPLNTCWPAHKVKVFRNATFYDYMKARSKARTAEETSNLASDFENEAKRRRIQKNLSCSEESIEEMSFLLSPQKRIAYQEKNLSIENPNDALNSSVLPEIPSHSAEPNPQKKYCCEGCQQNGVKLKMVIQQNDLLRSLVTDILVEVRQVRELEDINRNILSHCDESLFIKYDLKFPLNSEDDILTFDELLNVESNFNEAVIELAKIGGSNNYNMVKRILSSLLTNEEAMKYSWLGRKGKKPINMMKIAQLIISSVEKADLAKNRKETEQSIQAWLRRAKERGKMSILKNFNKIE